MRNIKIIGLSKEPKKIHDYLTVYECKAEGYFPEMYNGGWNDYHFEESVNFTFENIPLVPLLYSFGEERETVNYKWYGCKLECTDSSGKKKIGTYCITLDKLAEAFISEFIDFS